MKKYCYYFIDLDERIYADTGKEAEEIYDSTHSEPYTGDIELTDLKTGESHMMYHITIIENKK